MFRIRARPIMKKRRKWKLDPACPYLTSPSLYNATSRSLMSFAFRRNTIVCLLEQSEKPTSFPRSFLLSTLFPIVLRQIYLSANLFTFSAFFSLTLLYLLLSSSSPYLASYLIINQLFYSLYLLLRVYIVSFFYIFPVFFQFYFFLMIFIFFLSFLFFSFFLYI